MIVCCCYLVRVQLRIVLITNVLFDREYLDKLNAEQDTTDESKLDEELEKVSVLQNVQYCCKSHPLCLVKLCEISAV